MLQLLWVSKVKCGSRLVWFALKGFCCSSLWHSEAILNMVPLRQTQANWLRHGQPIRDMLGGFQVWKFRGRRMLLCHASLSGSWGVHICKSVCGCVCVCIRDRGHEYFSAGKTVKEWFFSACVCGLPGMSVISCFWRKYTTFNMCPAWTPQLAASP